MGIFSRKSDKSPDVAGTISRFKPVAKNLIALLEMVDVLDQYKDKVSAIGDADSKLSSLNEEIATANQALAEANQHRENVEEDAEVAKLAAQQVRTSADKDAQKALAASQAEAKSIISKAQAHSDQLERANGVRRNQVAQEITGLAKRAEELAADQATLEAVLEEQRKQIALNDEKISAFKKLEKQYG